MLLSFPPFFARSRRGAMLFILTGLASCLPMRLATAATVVPGDTYSIKMVAYATSDPANNYYAIYPLLSPTFGTTQTFPSDADLGQTLTVTSGETVLAGVTTDTITVSVPNSFVSETTNDGANNNQIIDGLEFSIGTYNNGTNTLDFTATPALLACTGSANYTLGGVPAVAPENPTFMTAKGTGFSAEEALTSSGPTVPISDYNVKSFTFVITYGVPEPSTYAMALLGLTVLGWSAHRSRASGVRP